MIELVKSDKIDSYVSRTTSPKMPSEQYIAACFLKSFFTHELGHNKELNYDFIDSFDTIRENMQKFLLLNSYGSGAGEFADEPFYSILRYSMNKKDVLLFQMIQETFWKMSSEINIYINVNKALDDVRYTDIEASSEREDCEVWDGKTWYCTDTLNLYTDMDNVNPNLDIPSFYVRDAFGTDINEEEKKKYVTESEYDGVYAKYARFISLVKPARYSILDNPIPLYAFELVSQKSWGTWNGTYYWSAFYTMTAVSSASNVGYIPYTTTREQLDKYSDSGNNYDTVKQMFDYFMPVTIQFTSSSNFIIKYQPLKIEDYSVKYEISEADEYPGKIFVDIILKIPSDWVTNSTQTKLGIGFTSVSEVTTDAETLVVFDTDKQGSNGFRDIGLEKDDGYRYAAFHFELYC